ncbi:DNA-directed RNA polymerase II subunit RPB11 [Nematocida sp. LUAm3]|nr:DNA-directed RNA polymerase II subunit RPB11 [Nematocida sp. LUAm3]KAI5173546.1 DNA-directed RNA polymerase II subunit RPB11 [Nematocida sp. LUAm2]KAI5176767.1 DNA-directed RNA polymerase II subunit RPB11 [Nematocida sp. LUAm1]
MDTLQKNKVIITEDKLSNSIELSIRDETHTLGNLLASTLQEDEQVAFSAYKIPHPLQNILKVKVALKEGVDESPVVIVRSALERLINECDSLLASVQQSR